VKKAFLNQIMNAAIAVFGSPLFFSAMIIKEYDVVALTSEIQAVHKATNQPLLLKQG
jgi:hypothetical protein